MYCEIVDFEKWRNSTRVSCGRNRYKNNAHDLMVIKENGSLRWLYTPNHRNTAQQLYLFRPSSDVKYLL